MSAARSPDGLDMPHLALQYPHQRRLAQGLWPADRADHGRLGLPERPHLSILWKPNDRFKALLTLSAWQDKSYNQMGQLYGIAELSPKSPEATVVRASPTIR